MEVNKEKPHSIHSNAFLDITAETCPMTFVKTKVTLEGLESGAVLHVRLNGGEPLKNVPVSAREIGHDIILHVENLHDGTHSLFIQKKG